MNAARNANGEFRHPLPAERPSRGDVGDDYGFGSVGVSDALELNADEMAELEKHEAVIEKGLKTFYEVGMALAAIRAARLYRQTHATFEEYCRDRWQLQERRAYQFMDAASVVETLKVEPLVQLPSNERQARPLATLPPEQLREAWQVAVESAPNGKPTATQVQAAVDQVRTPPRIHYGPNEDDFPQDENVIRVDEYGNDILPLLQVRTPGGHIGTLLSVSGCIAEVETVNGVRQYDVDKLTNLGKGELVPAVQTPPTNYNYKRDSKSSSAANKYVPQGRDLCQTPGYAIDPLLPYLHGNLTIWEPAAGDGLLVEAFHDSGVQTVIASDIQTGQNFFEYEPPQRWDVLITNPPFSLKFKWLERCYALGKPFALLLPLEALGAMKTQIPMKRYGFEIMFLNRRINFKMPNKGWEGGGAQFPTVWLCWKLLPREVNFGDIEYPSDEPEVSSDDDNG